jgi:hypothetical protein
LTADFCFAISVFFFVLVGCFGDLALLFDFDALTRLSKRKYDNRKGKV